MLFANRFPETVKEITKSMLITKNVADLKPHPMNEYLFDDIEGDKWEEFLDSVDRDGIITPLVITEDGTIVSGHQRWRACIARNIPTVDCYVYEPKGDSPDDDIELALIESNVNQRGVINSPTVKLGRMLAELERIHGVDKRGAGGRPAADQPTRKTIREHLKIDQMVAKCSKAVAQMPKEVQDCIEEGTITVRTAYDTLRKLTPEEQIEVIKQLDSSKRYIQSEVQSIVADRIPNAEKVAELQEKLAEYQKNDGELELREQLREVQEKERKTYEEWQTERRARKKDRAEFEKRMDAMEKLLDEQGGDNSEEVARLIEERDQYMKDADAAQADADIELVSSLIGALSGAFAEVANDPRPLRGSRAGTAFLMINQLEEKLEQIRERLRAGNEEIAAFDNPEAS